MERPSYQTTSDGGSTSDDSPAGDPDDSINIAGVPVVVLEEREAKAINFMGALKIPVGRSMYRSVESGFSD